MKPLTERQVWKGASQDRLVPHRPDRHEPKVAGLWVSVESEFSELVASHLHWAPSGTDYSQRYGMQGTATNWVDFGGGVNSAFPTGKIVPNVMQDRKLRCVS